MARSRSFAGVPAQLSRWLRADARDVVRIEPSREGGVAASGAAGIAFPNAVPPAASPAPSLDDGLRRWGARLSRRRLIALLRRRLIVAGGLAVVLELIALSTGAGRPARTLWLLLPAAIVLAGVAGGLRRPLAEAQVARLLDHDLALAERVGTALEVQPTAALPTAGLPAVVVAEARMAVSSSLSAARAALIPAGPEWRGLLAVVVVLGVVLALPATSGGEHRATGSPAAAAAARRSRGAAAPARPSSSAVTHAAARGVAGQGHRPPPLSFGTAQTPAGASRELARGPSGGKPSGGAPPRQLAHGGNGELGPHTGAGAGQSGAGATAGSRAATGGQASTHGGSATAGRGGGGSASAAGHGSHSPAKAATGAQAGKGGSANAPGQGGAGSKSTGAPGAFRGRHSPPGGETAGRARGSGSPSSRRVAPNARSGGAGLPIQAGYTPSHTARGAGQQGSGPTVSGGSGRARSAHAGVGGGIPSASFPYIAPTPNAASGVDENLLLNYFSPRSVPLSASW